jgi:integrase/recombinase XerD
LVFARNRTGTPPSRLDVGDIDATLVAAFLTDLETGRATACPPATAGHRRSSVTVPEHAESIQRVLAIPAKRHQQNLVCFLTATRSTHWWPRRPITAPGRSP